MYTLAPLPYESDALEPYISQETLEIHHGKHLQTYVNNLNNLVVNTEYADKSIEEIVRTAPAGGIFNNAAQIYNHDFYFSSLGPTAENMTKWKVGPFSIEWGKSIPNARSTELESAICAQWGDYATFQKEFDKMALANFGSGWTWLVKKPDGTVDIVSTSNAGTPIMTQDIPLLVVDVWEHAYYVDYRNVRKEYLENIWNIVNWVVVSERYSAV
jgi:Fe-Mn family superoxide dismutase